MSKDVIYLKLLEMSAEQFVLYDCCNSNVQRLDGMYLVDMIPGLFTCCLTCTYSTIQVPPSQWFKFCDTLEVGREENVLNL